MGTLMLDGDQVRELLPMSACIEALDGAMRGTSAGTFEIPPRTFTALSDQSGFLGVMPGTSTDPLVYGVKIISLHPSNPERGLPAIQGVVVLFEHQTGTPLVILDGAELTAIRTAAASGLATRELARLEAATLGIFGYGVQARTHLDAIAAVRDIEEVLVWGRAFEKAEAFAALHSQRTGLKVRAVQDASDAARCDVVCTVTGSHQAVLEGRWLEPGAHVNLVGTHTPEAREADACAIRRSRVFVDSAESAATEAGDILMAIAEGVVDAGHTQGEIGQVLAGEVPGRTGDSEITLYKSVGLVSQDLAAAYCLYQRVARAPSA